VCVCVCVFDEGVLRGQAGTQSGQGDGGRSSRLASAQISLPPPPSPAHQNA
jgi:hypothetical protein